MGGQVYTALSRAIDPDYLQIINFSYQKLWCEQKVKRFYHYLTTGKETKLYEKKINWHKKYLKDKTRKKYKEFAAVHQQTKEWPYENIKEFLSDQSNEYFKAFSEAVEKSISNSQNLIACRELLKFLKKWWKDNINILEKNTSK
jgi:RecG-like helicase